MTITTLKGKRGNTYKSLCMVKGKRVNRTFKSRSDAKLHEAKLLTDADYAHKLTCDVRLTLDKVINDFCDWYCGISFNTNGDPIRDKESGKIIFEQPRGKDWCSLNHRVNRWSKALGHKPIGKINSNDINGFLNELKAERKAPATINRYKSAFSKVFLFAIEERKIVRTNPCDEVRHLKENNEIVRYLTDEEIKSLLVECRENEWDRLYLLVQLALTTGARRSELLGLTWERVNFNTRSAFLVIYHYAILHQLKPKAVQGNEDAPSAWVLVLLA